MTKPELRRQIGFGTCMKLDEFLKARDIYEPYTAEDLERERRDLAALEPEEESRVRARR